jgi:uncharacterized protein YndB with AHSA1/START domain
MDTNVTRADARSLGMTRRIPAPPAAVFAAWTQPERIMQWFGPYGMTAPEAEVDLRPGGFHRTLMRDAEGKDYPNRMEIDEVAAPHRLVLRVADDSCGPLVGATGTLLFEAEGEGTRLSVTWRHPTPEMRAAHEEMGFVKGWGETLDKLTAHVLASPAPCPGASPPTPEHGWLHRLLGEWRYETECSMGPGQPVERATGTERVRSLGGYWVIGESEGQMPGGGTARWTISIGFDPAAKRFRGSFIGSMMPHMFVYDGKLEEDGRTLTLDTEGPAMSGQGTARYRDVVEMRGEDERALTSLVQGEDGNWTPFMTSVFRRIA